MTLLHALRPILGGSTILEQDDVTLAVTHARGQLLPLRRVMDAMGVSSPQWTAGVVALRSAGVLVSSAGKDGAIVLPQERRAVQLATKQLLDWGMQPVGVEFVFGE